MLKLNLPHDKYNVCHEFRMDLGQNNVRSSAKIFHIVCESINSFRIDNIIQYSTLIYNII